MCIERFLLKKEYLNSLFQSLKEMKLIKNYSDLSKKLGVSKSLVSSWLSGRSSIPIDKLLQISEIFNVQIIFKNGTFTFSFTALTIDFTISGSCPIAIPNPFA